MESLNINQLTLAWLNSINGISNRKIDSIFEYFNGSTKDLWDNFEVEKYNLKTLSNKLIAGLSNSKDTFKEKLLKKLHDENAQIVTVFDENYPEKLKQISGAPYILYYKGSLEDIDKLSIAVVGSRKATGYGKWVAEKLTRELSQLDVNIISGLASGIDTIAHKTALVNNVKTVGIIGCGINIVYPKSNEKLYHEIVENGGTIITEYTFGMEPMPNNFHDRNRIISGLSDGVLVVEAQEKSGTLITAGHAANQGKEIFSVPGNIDSFFSKGTNSLIRDGAKITTSINDIVEEILELKERVNKKQNFIDYNDLSEQEIIILNSLQSGSKSIFEINEETSLDIKILLSRLTFLEMKGVIKQIPGNRFTLG
ncbi:DNA-processing protein DprA [Sedimentibacter sp.]|uniref:DNA-processing protein DprA n=1 Tax=Sedimentibacter sp. TaxID=1960295 RepID=UPI0028ADB436|nr:DNA-processing protein DprA [Sedimentibacter sp.]